MCSTFAEEMKLRAPLAVTLAFVCLVACRQEAEQDLQDPTPRPMKLPRCVFQSDQDVSDLLKALRSRPEQEVDIAASKSFYNWPPDWDEIYAAWELHYRESQAAATAVLGSPDFDGRWDEPSFPGEEVLHEYLSAHLLTVWRQGDELVYLRFGHEDKELPFVIALGTKKAKGDAYSYPGQFDEDPVEDTEVPEVDPSRTAYVTLVGDRVKFESGESSLNEFMTGIMSRQKDFDAIEFTVILHDSRTMINLTQRVHALPFQVSILIDPDGPNAARVANVLVIQDRANFEDSDLSVAELIEVLRSRADQLDEVVISLFPAPDDDPRPTIDAGLKDTGIEVIYVLPPGRE